MHAQYTVAKHSITAAVILSVLTSSGAWLFLRASLPQTTGIVRLTELHAPAKIIRDRFGIPTIVAQNDHDLYLSLGFVHAQDRLFQMDLQRRLATGRLAEIFGQGALKRDRFMRTLGLRQHGEASLAAMSPAVREALLAYSAGVNAFIHQLSVPPIEYTVLNVEPDEWSPADTVALAKLIYFQNTGNIAQELRRARLELRLTRQELDEIFPDYPPVAAPSGRLGAASNDMTLRTLLGALPFAQGDERASNDWVIGGQNTTTGKPLLANDPHLGFTAPIVWYLAKLVTPQYRVAGGTIPGAPLVILGHNDHIAWGYTTTNADTQDLFVEALDPSNPSRYLGPSGPIEFVEHEEVIRIKGMAAEVMKVRSTRHGPVISDVVEEGAPAGQILALQATFLSDEDRSIEAQWLVDRASSRDDWLKALRLYAGPPENMVYADREGNIGFMVPGLIPVRARGDGRAPVPGQSTDFDWTGFIPFDELPRTENPASGYIASANNKIVPDSYPYLITHDWGRSYRIDRIEAMLTASAPQTIDKSALIQADTESLAAKRLLPLLLNAPSADPRSEIARRMLRDWDARMSADRPEPLVYAAWVHALNAALFKPKLKSLYGQVWRPSAQVTYDVLTKYQHWCGPPGCDSLISSALRAALDWGEETQGADVQAWHWGRAHAAFFKHPVFSRVPILNRLFDRRVPADGAGDTVNAGAFTNDETTDRYADVHGPGMRAIYDLSNLDASVFQLALGQSAHVLSSHYADLQDRWRRFAWVPIAEEPGGDVLILRP